MSLDGGAPIALPDEPPGPGIIRGLWRLTLLQREMKDIGWSEHADSQDHLACRHRLCRSDRRLAGRHRRLGIVPSFAQAPAASPGQRSTELFNRVMDDVLGRRLTVRLTERDPGNGSAAHRHPGSHTIGYILEGTYEVKIDEGPVRTLKPGDVFYEAPNALHAISRNPSSTQPLKYL